MLGTSVEIRTAERYVQEGPYSDLSSLYRHLDLRIYPTRIYDLHK